MRLFTFRLALALGMTVRELLARIDSGELSEWIAYYNIEPFGEERADYRQGITSWILANQWRDKSAAALKIMDFMPYSRPAQSPQQTPEDMMRHMQMVSKHLRVKRGDD